MDAEIGKNIPETSKLATRRATMDRCRVFIFISDYVFGGDGPNNDGG